MNRKQRMAEAYNLFEEAAEKVDEAIALLAEEEIDVIRYSVDNMNGVEVHFFSKDIIIPEFAESIGYRSREIFIEDSDKPYIYVEADTPEGTTRYFQIKRK